MANQILRPAGPFYGYYNTAWSVVPPAPYFAAINDVVADGDASYLAATVPNSRFTVRVDASIYNGQEFPSAAQVRGLLLVATVRAIDVTPTDFKFCLKCYGNNIYDSEVFTVTSASYIELFKWYPQTPNGSAWSAGIFYDLEMGLLYLSGSAEFRCTKMEAHIVTELLPNWRLDPTGVGFYSDFGGKPSTVPTPTTIDGSFDGDLSYIESTTALDVSTFPLSVPPPLGPLVVDRLKVKTLVRTTDPVASAECSVVLRAPTLTFAPSANASVLAIAIQADQKIVIGGSFTTIDGVSRWRLARLNTDGSLDLTFDPHVNGIVRAVVVQPTGHIVFGGDFTTVGGVALHYIARVDSTGVPDLAFNPDADDVVRTLAIEATTNIVLGGDFLNIGVTARNRLARITAAGVLDGAFDPNANGSVHVVVIQPDTNILVGGAFTDVNGGTARNRIARIDAAGVATAFDPNADDVVDTIAIQADTNILVGGLFHTIVATPRNHVARVTAAGAIDAAFDPGPDDFVVSLFVQADQNIWMGGAFTVVNGFATWRLVRLFPSGALDTTVNPWASNIVAAIAVQADGKYVIGGHFTDIEWVTRNRLARLTAAGALDFLLVDYLGSTNLIPSVVPPDQYPTAFTWYLLESEYCTNPKFGWPSGFPGALAWVIGDFANLEMGVKNLSAVELRCTNLGCDAWLKYAPLTILDKFPTANGFHHGLPPVVPNVGELAWQDICEDPPDDATTYIGGTVITTPLYASFTFGPSGPLPVGEQTYCVELRSRVCLGATVDALVAHIVVDPGTGETYIGRPFLISDTGTTWFDIKEDFFTSPITGTKWTSFEIDALEYGLVILRGELWDSRTRVQVQSAPDLLTAVPDASDFQLTDLADFYIARSKLDGTIYNVSTFGVGTGGYNPLVPTTVVAVNKADIALAAEVAQFPVTSVTWEADALPYEVTYWCRVPRTALHGNLIGEVGLYATILWSPVPAEIGVQFLFAILHMPAQSCQEEDVYLFPLKVNFP